MKVLVIANPIAGGGKGLPMAEALCRALRARGIAPGLYITKQAGEARAQAGAPGVECVVAVGGDGSVNEVANGMAGTDAILAILPLGTANVVARELGLPPDPAGLAELIARRSIRTIDAGRFGERRFLLGASAGPDAAVVEEVHRTRGKRLSFASYARPLLRVLARYQYPKITVTVDGTTLCNDADYVVVGNCRYSAGVFPVTPEARLDDGLLDVCVVKNLSALRLGLLALATWRPGFARRRDLTYLKGRSISLTPSDANAVPLQVDGDPAGQLPAAFVAEPAALRVIAPTG